MEAFLFGPIFYGNFSAGLSNIPKIISCIRTIQPVPDGGECVESRQACPLVEDFENITLESCNDDDENGVKNGVFCPRGVCVAKRKDCPRVEDDEDIKLEDCKLTENEGTGVFCLSEKELNDLGGFHKYK